jgi:hypothetical protein
MNVRTKVAKRKDGEENKGNWQNEKDERDKDLNANTLHSIN